MKTPYVYIVKNKTTGLKYIGAKYSKSADTRLLWVTYFTSSKRVKALIDIFGTNDFVVKVLKTFETPHEALLYENKLNKLAFHREDYLNIHYNFVGDDKDLYLFGREKQRKASSISGKMSYLAKTGIHGISKEKKLEYCAMGGIASAKSCRITGRGIFDPEVRKRQHETLKTNQKSAYYDPALKKEIAKKGGNAGPFTKTWYENNGIPEEERIKAQSRRGKKGGKNNKGFRWYNDGKNKYKYTVAQQKEKDFDSFLAETGYSLGRGDNANKNRIWVNDGYVNSMVFEEDFDEKLHNKGRLGNRSKYNGHKNKVNRRDE